MLVSGEQDDIEGIICASASSLMKRSYSCEMNKDKDIFVKFSISVIVAAVGTWYNEKYMGHIGTDSREVRGGV